MQERPRIAARPNPATRFPRQPPATVPPPFFISRLFCEKGWVQTRGGGRRGFSGIWGRAGVPLELSCGGLGAEQAASSLCEATLSSFHERSSTT